MEFFGYILIAFVLIVCIKMYYDFRLCWFPSLVLVQDYLHCHDFRLRCPSSLAEQHAVALQTVG